MSRRSERLFEAIGTVKEEVLEETLSAPAKKRLPWKRYSAIAAALALVVGLGTQLLPRFGGGSGSPGEGAGSGTDGSSVFMSYEGPVFPLTMLEENNAITAQRDVTLDFAPWLPVWVSNESRLDEARAEGASEEELKEYAAQLADLYEEGGYYRRSTDLLVTDTYVLTNTSEEEQTVELLYPFASTLRGMKNHMPSLTVNGSKILGTVIPGGYCGSFIGAGGETHEVDTLNLQQPSSWEDYKAALSDGSYLERAMGPYPDLTQIPVTVYRFTNAWGPEESEENPNPTIKVAFDWGESKTTMLSYGFQGGSYDPDRIELSFSVPSNKKGWYKEKRMLILLGEDLENMTTACYNTGGWDNGVVVDGGVEVERLETTLDEALREAAQEMYEDEWQFGEAIDCDFEMYYGLLCDYLCTYGLLSDDVKMRYDQGWLESLDFEIVSRVFYLCQSYTIPAGEEIVVSLTQKKEASFDYHCVETENKGVSGYDMVTKLASNLIFTGQSAKLEDHGQIEIIRQNFGFDLEQDIRDVELDMECEHYYLEVRPAKTGK